MTKAESIHLINAIARTMKSAMTNRKEVGNSVFVANVVKLICLFNSSKNLENNIEEKSEVSSLPITPLLHASFPALIT